MAGTRFFSRMNYNVRRGLREIVAPNHNLKKKVWQEILTEFNGQCAYCGSHPSEKNRGIVPDHLIPVTDFGELIPGNTIPACQACNDSRGNREWKSFIEKQFPADSAERIRKIEDHIALYEYLPKCPETSLEADELAEYNELLAQWEALLVRAHNLKKRVSARRSQ